MGKIIFFIIILAALFVIQQSRVIESVKVYDSRLGVSVEQYRFNGDNFDKYVKGIKKKIQRTTSRQNRYR